MTEHLAVAIDPHCGTNQCCLDNDKMWVGKCLAVSSWSHWVVIGLSIFGILWGVFQAMGVKKIEINDKDMEADKAAAEESQA